jgi:hypothetical protein
METSDRLTQLEAELKVLKNEVLAVLLDVKEKMLDKENPFTTASQRVQMPSVTIAQAAAPAEMCKPRPQYEPQPKEEEVCEREPVKAQALRTGSNRIVEEESECREPVAQQNYNQSRPRMETREQPSLKEPNEITRAFRLFEGNDTFTEQPPVFKDSLPLASLAGLATWVETTTVKLGAERTQIILDVSEMMGQLPAELKLILEKIVTRDGLKNPEKIYARDYLNALKELARLLGSKNTADFVALHIVSHGLNALARNNQDG